MPYTVTYQDETGYEWSSTFETQQEALAQAASDTNVYGGTQAQEIKDETGIVVADQNAIEEAAAGPLP